MRTALLTLAALLAPVIAHAQDQQAPPPAAPPPIYYYAPYPAYPPPPPPKPKREWYGWQTLTADALAITVLYYAAQSRRTDGPSYVYASLALYTVGAPVVHFAHGNPGRGVVSLALRSLPSLALLGDTRSNDFALLALLSIPAAIAIDAAVLAREDEAPPPKGPTVAPTASITKSGGLIGLNGTF